MKIEYLREFVVLTKYMNFTLASEQLFISQPVLSRHIRALEQELGIRLLERNTSAVSITDDGQFFLKHIQKVLSAYDEVLNNLQARQSNHSYTLRVGGGYYAMADYLSDVPKTFALQTHNDCLLSCLAVEPAKCPEYLSSGELDIALMPQTSATDGHKFICKELFVEPLVALMNRDNPLSNYTYLTIGDLKNEEFYTLDYGPGGVFHSDLRQSFVESCARFGFEPYFRKSYSQMIPILIDIKNYGGVYVGERHLLSLSGSYSLAAVPIIGQNSTRTICAVYDADNRHPYIAAFLQAFQHINRFGWPSTFTGSEDYLE